MRGTGGAGARGASLDEEVDARDLLLEIVAPPCIRARPAQPPPTCNQSSSRPKHLAPEASRARGEAGFRAGLQGARRHRGLGALHAPRRAATAAPAPPPPPPAPPRAPPRPRRRPPPRRRRRRGRRGRRGQAEGAASTGTPRRSAGRRAPRASPAPRAAPPPVPPRRSTSARAPARRGRRGLQGTLSVKAARARSTA